MYNTDQAEKGKEAYYSSQYTKSGREISLMRFP